MASKQLDPYVRLDLNSQNLKIISHSNRKITLTSGPGTPGDPG